MLTFCSQVAPALIATGPTGRLKKIDGENNQHVSECKSQQNLMAKILRAFGLPKRALLRS